MEITLKGEIEKGKIYMVDLTFVDETGRKLRELKSQVYTDGSLKLKRWAKAAKLTTGNKGEIKDYVKGLIIKPVRIISSKI